MNCFWLARTDGMSSNKCVCVFVSSQQQQQQLLFHSGMKSVDVSHKKCPFEEL